ncbi:heme oxygenase-like protein [Apiospora aurea]|uniref:Heme oxygenase-like protein n=1 Tax=Apiospora aurea TaxID=335848 RepID=A0ABR1QTK4_9PEZI
MPSRIEETCRPLSEAINIATRPVHTQLNKLVIYRLPLAIPPHVQDPSNYVSGLLHLTPIYNGFESLWREFLESPQQSSTGTIPAEHSCEVCKPSAVVHHSPYVLDAPHIPTLCSRIHSLLHHVHTPDLERTEALKADIVSMTGWSTELLAEQLSVAEESPVLSAFLMRLRQSVRTRPHVLLAYAWVLYMALFSGGRFIRASLAQVHPSFWNANCLSLNPELPLRFFTFDTAQGGDEIKSSFKERFAQSSGSLLTDGEKADVVDEAKKIFEFMIEVVGELDGVCGTGPNSQDANADEGIMSRMSRLLGLRTRDSVVVTKERREWAKLFHANRTAEGSGSGSSENERSNTPSPTRGMKNQSLGEHVHWAGSTRSE